ncbi:MAG: (2Fe-2S)-binding protein, partial [Candidatus Krumholzibacteriota bacterium]|nr:(2Fe-2S)-binding protein [Candidatus Krumholzibacteriota bacterium]
MSVTIKVNGNEIEAPDGAWLIDVCRDNGIEIPNFCYHPGLGPDGNCRMCQVEFISPRGNRLGISCNAVVAEGMEVNTESAPALRARASVEEFLLLNHPLDCPICDKAGECSLQDYYMSHDLENSRQNFTRFRENKAMDIGPTLILDQERCVLCDRCVRFLRDVAGDEQLFIAGRGHEAYITTFPGKEVTSPYSLNTVDLCPVGALTAKDFRFASSTWFLKNTPSVCTTCARGCSMQLQVHRNFTDKAGEHRDRVMRFRPRHNPEVNGYWACDEGRLNYRFVNEGRIDAPFVRIGGEVFVASQEEALAELRQILGFSRTGGNERTDKMNVVLLASAHATLEEMFLLKRLAGRLDASVFVARHCADGEDDALLRRADRHPNAMGAERLGIDVLNLQRSGEGDEAVREHLGEGGVLVCVGFNVEITDAIVALASRAGKVVALS